MALDLTGQYSGIFLNQNATPTSSYDWREGAFGNWIYQTFTLPTDYDRGTSTNELRIPDISGFQILVSIDNGYEFSATMDYVLQYFAGDNDTWPTLAAGTVIGNHASGDKVWFDLIFPEPISVPASLLNTTWRLGVATRSTGGGPFKQPVVVNSDGTYTIDTQTYDVTLTPNVPYPIIVNTSPAFLYMDDLDVTYSLQQGVSVVWYVSPSPLTTGAAYQFDTLVPLLGPNTSSCLNFRALGLIADSGVDFLGNEYRSCVVQASAGNTVTTSGLNPVEGSGQGSYWMSPPQPSRFAVQNLYFDVRPVADTPVITQVNLAGNPSFEYDHPGQAPHWWLPFTSGGTVVDQTVKSIQLANTDPNYTSWVTDRYQSLHMKYNFSGSNQVDGIISDFYGIPATVGGQPNQLSLSLNYDLLLATHTALVFSALFYNSAQTLLAAPYGTQSVVTATPGTGTLSGTFTVPANASYVKFLVSGAMVSGVTGSFEASVDSIQITETASVQPYFDGDDVNSQWVGQKGQSVSVQVMDQEPENNFVVIDGVLLDPITPNVAFNVYYTQDDSYTSDHMTEDDWDQKLWIHIPKSYIAVQRQQYAFPEPVHAKYIKIEFSNLQPQTFDPGPFQKPVAYKKFPTWVASFFVGLLESPSFVASQVSVQYDALTFAYQYFLDDLSEAPDQPVAPPSGALAQLTNYFNQPPTGVDGSTLGKINFVMQQYQIAPGGLLGNDTAVNRLVSQLYFTDNATAPPVTAEGSFLTPVDYSTVSSLQREPVLIEQSTPVMYFFLTCRHGYKEVLATFSHNRAFFAGVNEISLVRNDYTVAADTPLYIETGGDPINVAMSDFVLDDNIWYVY